MPINTKPQAKYPVKPAVEILPVVLSAKEVVFADLETTGFGAYDDITEIGAIRVNIETGAVLNAFSSLCHLKIQSKVPLKIVELTQITTQMLEDAPRIETVLPAFRQFIGATPLSFHNASFDWTMLGRKYECLGQRLTNEVICTRKLFHFLHPSLPDNLEYITGYYGRKIEGHHRAYVDCKWAAACYRKMREELLADDTVQEQLPDSEAQAAAAIPELSYEELEAGCFIHRISGWKKGKMSRIYCSTSVADFFFDLNERVWNVSRNKTQKNLNIDALARFILAKVGLDMAGFEARYRAV